jgi:type II secretory pathway component GspD/PulD (secretin)
MTGVSRVRNGVLAALILLLAASPVRADERVSRVHPLGMADGPETYEIVQSLLTEAGRAVLDEGHNSIIVLDVPAVQDRVADLLARVQGPLPSVRVAARFVDRETGEAVAVGASGQLLLAWPPAAGATAVVGLNASGREGSRSAMQEVLVVSGGSAVIAVGKEIPYQSWFYSYGRRNGFITGELRWREIGSRLAVRPVVVDGGRKVRLTVTPEFEYEASGGRKKRRETVSFTGVSTEIILAHGEEARIAVTSGQEDFYERFLSGYDRLRRARQVDVFIRAEVVPPG